MSQLVPTEPGSRFNVPRATYRLQFNHQFTFNAAARVVPYLAQLGISHVYASPILKARPGSMHGYDVVDHSQLGLESRGSECSERASRSLLRLVLADQKAGTLQRCEPRRRNGLGRAK